MTSNRAFRRVTTVAGALAMAGVFAAVAAQPALAAQKTSCGATSGSICYTGEVASSSSHKLAVVLSGSGPGAKATFDIFDVNTQVTVWSGSVTAYQEFTISGLYGRYSAFLATKSGRFSITLTNEV